MANLSATNVKLQPVSTTRKMAAALPGLREIAASKGLKMHHLGAGYPHPEVTDPRRFLAHQAKYFESLDAAEGRNDPDALPEYLRESYSYTDTLGPKRAREVFARAYGLDWDFSMDPQLLIPTIGATGGINLICSLFERAGDPVAYITDAAQPMLDSPRASRSASTPRFTAWRWMMRGQYRINSAPRSTRLGRTVDWCHFITACQMVIIRPAFLLLSDGANRYSKSRAMKAC